MDEAEIPEGIESETPEAVDPPEVVDELALEGDESGSPPDTEEHADAPEWVRELRKQNREMKRQLREQQKTAATSAPAAPQLGQKPTLESCDFDATEYEAKLDAWHAEKRKVEEHEAEARRARESEEAEWSKRLDGHTARTKDLMTRIPKAAEYVEEAEAALSPTQKGMVIHTSPESHRILAMLGKHPDLLAEVSKISDPALFVRRITELEMTFKGSTKPKAAPERVRTPSAAAGGSMPGSDAELERLEAEADRTGDRTKVAAYRRKLKLAGK